VADLREVGWSVMDPDPLAVWRHLRSDHDYPDHGYRPHNQAAQREHIRLHIADWAELPIWGGVRVTAPQPRTVWD
jgi:hypothetical protein